MLKTTTKKSKYFKQRTTHSCAPIAFMNTLKWAGKEFSYKKNFRFFKLAVSCGKDGSDYKNIFGLLGIMNLMGFNIYGLRHPNMSDIEKELDKNRLIWINSYVWQADSVHSFLITKHTNKYLQTINCEGKIEQWHLKTKFEYEYMKNDKKEPCLPQVFSIGKN
jgi:hypothetical protein